MLPSPQLAINTSLPRAALFLVLEIKNGISHADQTLKACLSMDALLSAVGSRDTEGKLTSVMAFGADAWGRLFGDPMPRELHPFRALNSGTRSAPSTPGDVFFHIRAERTDLCFELATQIMAKLDHHVVPVDEVHGFRYFDDRDLTGFVDGTANPTGDESVAATMVGSEDEIFAGGSYVMVQKYIHDHLNWIKLPAETQEAIIGRTKFDNIELDDAVKPTRAHNALTTLVENGVELKIRRHNMPFGNVSNGEAGTYFIGYARSPHPLEKMLERMVIGDPPGNYDRLLDFTHPVTGSLFFAPSVQFLTAKLMQPDLSKQHQRSPGELNIGSLKGESAT